jgi:hypothetical protein
MRTPLLLLLFFLAGFYSFAEKSREPFIVLKVNGKEYKSGDEIVVRLGEKVSVEAVMYGGRRDYCSNPGKYANIGKNTVVKESGDNGMSFSINGGQFTGTWSLKEELAVFSTNPKIDIQQTGHSNMQRSAILKIPQDNVSKILLKVRSETVWHYKRRTPSGIKNKE